MAEPKPTPDHPGLILGVSGLRGVVGESLTTDVARKYARCAGAWLRERSGTPDTPTVVLARDGRAGGETIADAARNGLLDAGCAVADLGVAMTPTAGVLTDRLEAAGAVIVTASHNPQQWNGLKCLVRRPGARGPDAAAPTAAEATELVERFRSGTPDDGASPGVNVTEIPTAAAEHAALVLEALEALDPGATDRIRAAAPPVVLDSVNASGVAGGRELLEALGCRVTHVGDDASGVFPHDPEPTRENLASLCAEATRTGASAAFAQDPDADRLAIVDGAGRYIGEEYTLALACASVLGAMGDGARGTVLAANLSTSRMIEDVAAMHGAAVARTPVGEANVVQAMKDRASPVGGEGNGGVVWPAVTYVRDSLAAMALVLALCTRERKTVAELVDAMPAYAIDKRKVPVPSRQAAGPAIERIVRAYQGTPGVRVDLQDGVRLDFDERRAWVHVRASNTEPVMRLIAEAPDAGAAAALLDEISAITAD